MRALDGLSILLFRERKEERECRDGRGRMGGWWLLQSYTFKRETEEREKEELRREWRMEIEKIGRAHV